MMWHHTVPLNRLIQGFWMCPGCAQQWVWFLHSYSHQTASIKCLLATILGVSFSLLDRREAGDLHGIVLAADGLGNTELFILGKTSKIGFYL